MNSAKEILVSLLQDASDKNLEDQVAQFENLTANDILENIEVAREELDMNWTNKIEINVPDCWSYNQFPETVKRYADKISEMREDDDASSDIGGIFKFKTLSQKVFSSPYDTVELSEVEIEVIKSLSPEEFKSGVEAGKKDAGWGEMIVVDGGMTKTDSEMSTQGKVWVQAFEATKELFEDEDDFETFKNDHLKVVGLADYLFDGELSVFETKADEISKADPREIFESIMAEKSIRGWSSKIDINIHFDVSDEVLDFMKFVHNSIRPVISDEEFSSFINVLNINNDVSVWGGDNWAPRILANGGVVFRNHHRVIGVDESCSGVINIATDDALIAIKELSEFASENFDEESRQYSWSLINHTADDGIQWSYEAPSELLGTGQTLLFVGRALIDKYNEEKEGAFNPFVSDEVKEVTESSRSGVCVIRIFNGVATLYSTSRFDDDFDALLEYYSYFIGETPDESNVYLEDVTWSGVSKSIKSMAEDNVFGAFDDERLDGLDETAEAFREAMIKNIASHKTNQTMMFNSIFTTDPHEAACYGGVKARYKDLSTGKEDRFAVFNFKYDKSENLDELSNSIEYYKDWVKDNFEVENIYLSLSTKDNLYGMSLEEMTDEERLAMLIDTSNEEHMDNFYDSIEEVRQSMLEEMGEDFDFDDEDAITEFLNYETDHQIRIITIFEESIAFDDLDEKVTELSGDEDNGPSLYLPQFGILQGYDCGGYDTGNMTNFTSSSW